MYDNIKSRIMVFLGILALMIIFPSHLFAQETRETVNYETGFYYTIQKGDTLWDLSARFSDSPWLWPDLWNENHQIVNPHWIYPGERIRLFHVKGVNTFVQKKVGKDLSLKKEKAKRMLYYYYSPIDSIGFIRKKTITPRGIIFKVKDDKKLISVGDLVYIRTNINQALKPGTKYTVYRTLKPIFDEKTKTLIGTQYYVTGIVKITRRETGYALAEVVKSYRSIAINDVLMPYKKRSPKIALTDSKKGLKGKIIVSEEHADIIGDETIAFIDKGGEDGITLGQSYSIYYQEREKIDPKKNENILLAPVVYGTLLVLHTEPTTSTVLITRADQSIHPGAAIRSPEE